MLLLPCTSTASATMHMVLPLLVVRSIGASISQECSIRIVGTVGGRLLALRLVATIAIRLEPQDQQDDQHHCDQYARHYADYHGGTLLLDRVNSAALTLWTVVVHVGVVRVAAIRSVRRWILRRNGWRQRWQWVVLVRQLHAIVIISPGPTHAATSYINIIGRGFPLGDRTPDLRWRCGLSGGRCRGRRSCTAARAGAAAGRPLRGRCGHAAGRAHLTRRAGCRSAAAAAATRLRGCVGRSAAAAAAATAALVLLRGHIAASRGGYGHHLVVGLCKQSVWVYSSVLKWGALYLYVCCECVCALSGCITTLDIS